LPRSTRFFCPRRHGRSRTTAGSSVIAIPTPLHQMGRQPAHDPFDLRALAKKKESGTLTLFVFLVWSPRQHRAVTYRLLAINSSSGSDDLRSTNAYETTGCLPSLIK
jgi:hypothetical protein